MCLRVVENDNLFLLCAGEKHAVDLIAVRAWDKDVLAFERFLEDVAGLVGAAEQGGLEPH